MATLCPGRNVHVHPVSGAGLTCPFPQRYRGRAWGPGSSGKDWLPHRLGREAGGAHGRSAGGSWRGGGAGSRPLARCPHLSMAQNKVWKGGKPQEAAESRPENAQAADLLFAQQVDPSVMAPWLVSYAATFSQRPFPHLPPNSFLEEFSRNIKQGGVQRWASSPLGVPAGLS